VTIDKTVPIDRSDHWAFLGPNERPLVIQYWLSGDAGLDSDSLLSYSFRFLDNPSLLDRGGGARQRQAAQQRWRRRWRWRRKRRWGLCIAAPAVVVATAGRFLPAGVSPDPAGSGRRWRRRQRWRWVPASLAPRSWFPPRYSALLSPLPPPLPFAALGGDGGGVGDTASPRGRGRRRAASFRRWLFRRTCRC